MNVENPITRQPTEHPLRPRPVAPPVVTLETLAAQLDQQAQLLHAMHQELMALRAAQVGHDETLTKIDRHLRWTRWGRRLRSAIFWLFWLGVAAVIAYYWADLSQIWADFARFLL